MKAREMKPRRLDVRAFIESGDTLSGQESLLPTFERLAQSLCADPSTATGVPPVSPAPDTRWDVHWRAQGEVRRQPGAPAQVWLHLQGHTHMPLQCQRCLDAVDTHLEVDRWFLFVESERKAAELDEDVEEDVLVFSRSFDLLSLLEDELLLALPLVPRHDECPTHPPLSYGDGDTAADVHPSLGDNAARQGAEESNPSAPDADVHSESQPHPFAALAKLRKQH